MPRFSLIAILVASTLAFAASPALPAAAASSQDYSHARIVRLSLVDGDVRVYRPETEQWEQALVNLPIQQGYAVATGQGRAEIEFESGATARIAENTVVQFSELALADGARITRLYLTQGTATFYANLSRKDNFIVATPQLQATISHNARFRMDALDTGTNVSVLKGDVAVDARDQSYPLTKGQTLSFREDAAEPVSVVRNVEPDEWDRWVANRDEVVSSARDNSLRYVSAPFQYGLADLSSYGNWQYNPFYGYVWQPWGLSPGWLPYWDGRWVFVPSFGWTWVSFEPWGWVPYHYGRWALTSFGWVWVPGGFRQWHPGLVAWFQSGNQIGWCPLGPRDRIGVVAANLQSRAVVVNTPTGVIGGAPNQLVQLSPNERPRISAAAPITGDAFEGRRERALDSAARFVSGAKGSAGTPSALPPPAVAPAGQAPRAPSTNTGAQSNIVFDRSERRFVNNPRPPVPPVAEERTVVKPAPVAPAAPPAAPSVPRTPRAVSPAAPTPARPAGVKPPAAPSAPRTQPAPSAPRPSPPPARIGSPRPMPSGPRSEFAPRPASPSAAPHASAPARGR